MSSLEAESYIGVVLVPRVNKGDLVQTTKVGANCSEFWDNEREDRSTFTDLLSNMIHSLVYDFMAALLLHTSLMTVLHFLVHALNLLICRIHS